VLASLSLHPHLICNPQSAQQLEANAAPGHLSSSANTHQGFHLIGESTLTSLSPPTLTSLSPPAEIVGRDERHSLNSIPETGFSEETRASPSHLQRLNKSRKRSNSSPVECPETLPSNQTRRGRKPLRLDMKSKLEKSRQSARECRARKKLRYQYLEELVSAREKAIFSLREEMEMYKSWCKDMDEGKIPPDMKSKMEKLEKKLILPGDERQASTSAPMEDVDDDDDGDSEEDDDSEEYDDEEDEEEAEKQPGGSN